MEGTIKNIIAEKGYGFITVTANDKKIKDLFFHSSDLVDVEFSELKVGDKVSFEKVETPKGLNAKNVTRL